MLRIISSNVRHFLFINTAHRFLLSSRFRNFNPPTPPPIFSHFYWRNFLGNSNSLLPSPSFSSAPPLPLAILSLAIKKKTVFFFFSIFSRSINRLIERFSFLIGRIRYFVFSIVRTAFFVVYFFFSICFFFISRSNKTCWSRHHNNVLNIQYVRQQFFF